MSVDGACPLCVAGYLTALLGTSGWLRCPTCDHSYDNRGHAYDRDWRPVRYTTT